jgi:hypothetical protein
MEKSKCKQCGQEIVWYPTMAGNIIPLDPVPVTEGMHAIIGERACIRDPGLFEETYTGPYYSNHFLTCPKRPPHPKEEPRKKK